MSTLSPIRLGCAVGIAASVFYIACVLFMAIAPADGVVWLSNSLLHGVDVKSIMRDSVPLIQTLVGVLGTFVGGCVFGSLTACLYNIGLRQKAESIHK